MFLRKQTIIENHMPEVSLKRILSRPDIQGDMRTELLMDIFRSPKYAFELMQTGFELDEYERMMIIRGICKDIELAFKFLHYNLFRPSEWKDILKTISKNPQYSFYTIRDFKLESEEDELLFNTLLNDNYYVIHYVIHVSSEGIKLNPNRVKNLIDKVTRENNVQLASTMYRNLSLTEEEMDLLMAYMVMDKLVNY